jgi:hypothetical protein
LRSPAAAIARASDPRRRRICAATRGDVGREAVADSMDRADRGRRSASVADRATRCRDAAGDRDLVDDDAGPHRVEQVLLAHDPVRMREQMLEDQEDLGLDGDDRPARRSSRRAQSSSQSPKLKLSPTPTLRPKPRQMARRDGPARWERQRTRFLKHRRDGADMKRVP